jgi:hypothetical protein
MGCFPLAPRPQPHPDHQAPKPPRQQTNQHARPFLAAPAAFACVWGLIRDGIGLPIGLGVTGGAGLLATVFMNVTCRSRLAPVYKAPLFPYTPAVSYMLNCFLMASLPANAYVQVGSDLGAVGGLVRTGFKLPAAAEPLMGPDRGS